MRLEIQFRRHNNELFGINNPSARDEAIFIDRLFSKYPTLKRELKQRNRQKGRHDLFNITLFTKGDHSGLKFVIGVNDGRGDMFCHAKDANDNVVAKLDPFNLDEDLNQVALFMLEQLDNNDFSDKVDESVQLSSLDCEYIERLIKDSLNSIDDLKDLDVYVDVNDDNADYGFLNIMMLKSTNIMSSIYHQMIRKLVLINHLMMYVTQ